MYTCMCKYCGEEIEISKIGGHTSFCKMNPNYERNIKRSSEQFIKVNEERRSNRNYGNCIYCGSPLNRSGKKFCNNSCAAKFHNQERKKQGYTTRGKTKIVQCSGCGKDIEVSIHTAHDRYICEECGGFKISKSHIKTHKCICVVCGKEFYSYRKHSTHCSSKCSNNDPATKEKLRQKQYKLIEEGKHQGWQCRNIRSYPEKFWKDVLDNNGIVYQQEVYIKEYQYFLDFLIETPRGKIDLEIDGSQHNKQDAKYKDKIRDERLTNMGYIIYRIPWNEINTGFGKELMKKKIDDFLKFIVTE